MAADKEKKNKKIALAVSTGVHILLFICFFFMLAWREPDPPIPEYGIELNFGLQTTGSGESPRPKPTPVVQREQKEEVRESKVEKAAETKPAEVVEEIKPTETVTQPEPSPQPVEKVPESPKEVIKETPKATETTQKPTPKPTETTQASNQGDDADKTGDKGKEEGKVDARAIYGAQGSGQGASLQMEGWNWDFIPRPDDTSSESGKIVFQIIIDEQGEVIGVKTLEKTVSPAVERLYKQAVESVTFSRTADNMRPAPTSTGRITFILRSR